MKVGDVIRIRNVRQYVGPKAKSSDMRLEWVEHSTKGTDIEFVMLYLGGVKRDKELQHDDVDAVLKGLGFVRAEELEGLDLSEDDWEALGFERMEGAPWDGPINGEEEE